MESCAKDVDRAAVAIVGGIRDELVVERGVNVFANLKVVVGFHRFFQSIIELAVSGQDALAARGEELLMNGGDGVDDAGQAKGVIGPSPELPLGAQAQGGGAVHIGVNPGFGVTVVPAQTGENADIGGNFLFAV